MIKTISSVFALLMFSTLLQAQKVPAIKVEEGTQVLSESSRNALSVLVYETSKDEIEKALKSELKDKDAKVTVKKEIFGDDAEFKFLGENTVDVYAKVEKLEVGNMLIVGVDLGGAFLSSASHPEKFKAFKAYLYNFAVELTKEGVGEQIKEAGKVLGKLEGDAKDLEKEKSNLEDKIEDAKKEIEEAQKNIEENIKNQAAKTEEVKKQKAAIETLNAKMKAVK